LTLSLVASGLKFVSLNFSSIVICLILSTSIRDDKLSSIRAPFIGFISSAVSTITSLFDVNSSLNSSLAITSSFGVESSSAVPSLIGINSSSTIVSAKMDSGNVGRSVRIVGSYVLSVGSSLIVGSSDGSSDCVGISDGSSLAVGLSDGDKLLVGESVGR